MSKELTTQQPQQQSGLALLKAQLNAPSVQEQFRNALAENKNAFIASIIDLYTADRQLQQCKPSAVVSEALRAAVLKLPLTKALGFSYIVVYNNNVKDADGRWHKVPTPTFILGYKGLIQLAMRTGEYRTLNANVVYEGEILGYDKLRGNISLDGQRASDKIVGYFAYMELLNGFTKMIYMTVKEMAEYAKRYSPSIGRDVTVDKLIELAQLDQQGKAVGWMGNFTDMAIKTVTRRLLSKYGYLSVEMQGAISRDIDADAAATRDDEIAARANTQEVNLDAVEYVDTETGEVVKAAPQPAAQPEQPEEELPDF